MEAISESLDILVDTVNQNYGIIEAVLTKFFTDRLFIRYMPDEVKERVNEITDDELMELPLRREILELPHRGDLYLDMPICSNVVKIVTPKLDVCPPQNSKDTLESATCSVCRERASIRNSVRQNTVSTHENNENTFIGVKKQHEVEEMVTAIVKLSEDLGITNVVDVGSGRGILGHTLNREHGLHVLGIESSDVSIHGGAKRIDMVDRRQPKLCNHCHSAVNKVGPCAECYTKVSTSDNTTVQCPCSTSDISGTAIKSFTGPEKQINNSYKKECRCCKKEKISNAQDKQFVSEGSFETILYNVTPEPRNQSELLKLIKSHRNFGSSGYILVGLHACGDLTSHVLKLFDIDSCAKGLCIVGCCYNLLTSSIPDQNSCQHVGFPLSYQVQQKQFVLTRAAGHLACQCPIKLSRECHQPQKSLLYRAILEVILKDLNWSMKDAMHFPKLRRMFKKQNNFTDYTKACYLKLTGNEIPLSDSEIENYFSEYKDKWQELRVYNQVHSSLAPYLETLILLDRLCYLYEQGHTMSRVVQLFCPLKSPRCYAIISNKN